VTHWIAESRAIVASLLYLVEEDMRMKFSRILVCFFFLFIFLATVVSATEGPTTVFAPQDVQTTPPDPGLPQDIKAFFGKTGKWWGTWYGTPPGHMEAILIIKKIIDSKTADIMYLVPNYPTWGIKAIAIERIAKFEKKDGKMFLVIPSPINTRFECSFDAGAFVGAIIGPHLTSNIVWETLQ
jgi:hypothetical protein